MAQPEPAGTGGGAEARTAAAVREHMRPSVCCGCCRNGLSGISTPVPRPSVRVLLPCPRGSHPGETWGAAIRTRARCCGNRASMRFACPEQ